MASKQQNRTERRIEQNLRNEQKRPLHCADARYGGRTGRLFRPSLKKWKHDQLVSAVETYILARNSDTFFRAETIASDLRADVSMVRHALHKLNLSGLVNQKYGGGLVFEWGCSRAEGWMGATYWRRREPEPVTKPGPAWTAEDCDWAVEGQAAGCDVVLETRHRRA